MVYPKVFDRLNIPDLVYYPQNRPDPGDTPRNDLPHGARVDVGTVGSSYGPTKGSAMGPVYVAQEQLV
jgi:hypothetical protein